ncbi:hypothetical protein L1887_20020 [Cichorium endivia]|nr:hypothetical protein L1887_20020 [Cichorium endivia]
MSTVATIKMEYSWPFGNWWLLVMIAILMFRPTKGGCIEEERRALLDIKFSLINSYDSEPDNPLSTWMDYGNGSECCDWERVNCNTTTGQVTQISFYNLTYSPDQNWPLNVSLFLHFKELTSLNLSRNYLDGGIMKAGTSLCLIVKYCYALYGTGPMK